MSTQIIELSVDEWITAKQASEILGVWYQGVKNVLIRGKVRRKQLPGTHAQYHKGDVEQLLADSIRTDEVPTKRAIGPIQKNERVTGSAGQLSPVTRPKRQKTA
jgi:hypothetical protein